MVNKKFNACTLLLFTLSLPSLLLAQISDGPGQTIQINTYLKGFVGRPSWLLIIRDIDSGQNIPYLYDFYRRNNFWLAFTYGRNYVITVSELQFSPYSRSPDCSRSIKNFCHLESNGRIIRGESIAVTIKGVLSPNTNTFMCQVMKYPDGHFVIVPPPAPPPVVVTAPPPPQAVVPVPPTAVVTTPPGQVVLPPGAPAAVPVVAPGNIPPVPVPTPVPGGPTTAPSPQPTSAPINATNQAPSLFPPANRIPPMFS